MSLGNYGNWLMMKRGISNEAGSQTSISSAKSAKSNQWTTYFAVMRDFNLFLFKQNFFPNTLNDVVEQDYLALSVAHIETFKQCNSNLCELYLEVTGSKTNHKLKFRCASEEVCSQWVMEMNYQIHIVSDLCCNQALRLECADQKRSIWIPVAPMTQFTYLHSKASNQSRPHSKLANNKENDNNNNNNPTSISSLNAASKQHHKNSRIYK